ncbi:hypothetical protein M0813_26764 [Anaeramoeba flamelloides]|uniref:Uncharacterized protein n=1 Tax=Anaeramoeba flamelloides TaxID=1746091 RepID=A0AAV8AFL7_9EUKA|nr:hypothetical protein M0812_04702 [Anaeramoeba flamelloides]KAJ6237209.1 hypothetical protein M0813_26764 [Anaeramoeba flamelloides]
MSIDETIGTMIDQVESRERLLQFQKAQLKTVVNNLEVCLSEKVNLKKDFDKKIEKLTTKLKTLGEEVRNMKHDVRSANKIKSQMKNENKQFSQAVSKKLLNNKTTKTTPKTTSSKKEQNLKKKSLDLNKKNKKLNSIYSKHQKICNEIILQKTKFDHLKEELKNQKEKDQISSKKIQMTEKEIEKYQMETTNTNIQIDILQQEKEITNENQNKKSKKKNKKNQIDDETRIQQIEISIGSHNKEIQMNEKQIDLLNKQLNETRQQLESSNQEEILHAIVNQKKNLQNLHQEYLEFCQNILNSDSIN